MKHLCLLKIFVVLLMITSNGINQEIGQNWEKLQEKLEKEKLKRELSFLSYRTKIGKKLSQVWDKVWGGEREKQRRDKYPTWEAYTHRTLDPDEKELINEMLEFAKGWKIWEIEGGKEYKREFYMEVSISNRITILQLLRRIAHVSMIDSLSDIPWNMSSKLKKAVNRWLSGELEKEIEKGIKLQEELIEKWRKKGLSEEEAEDKGMEEFHKIKGKTCHPLEFEEIDVMREAIVTLASIPDERVMDELLRLLDHPLPPIAVTALHLIDIMRGTPIRLPPSVFLWLQKARQELEEKDVPWYSRAWWEITSRLNAAFKEELTKWWKENKGKVRLRHEVIAQIGLPEIGGW